jgi:hypothetical protein
MVSSMVLAESSDSRPKNYPFQLFVEVDDSAASILFSFSKSVFTKKKNKTEKKNKYQNDFFILFHIKRPVKVFFFSVFSIINFLY